MLKVLLPPLECKPGLECWCAQIEFVADEPTSDMKCLTPDEMLVKYKDRLSNKDILFLQKLRGRVLITQ